jgi:hypothetical protein
MRHPCLLAPLLALLAGPAAAEFFQTPSGNVHCYGQGGPDAFVDCEVLETTAGPLLARPRDCDMDWGRRFSVAAAGPAGLVCAGDTLRDAGSPVLPYGSTLSFGPIACTSSETGLRCRNPEGRGFALARGGQQLF